MIIKPRKYPIAIRKLKAIQGRLSQSHPKHEIIRENIAKRIVGYNGEQSLDYHLSFLDEKTFHIMHDVRLFDGKHYFQIDTLILSRKFIYLLEVKNISGTLFVDNQFNQLIRTQNNTKEAFLDPLIQVERQCNQLNKWLKLHKIRNLQIKSLIVISSPRTILETFPNNEKIHQKVIHSAKLPFKMKYFEESQEKNLLTENQLNKLSKLIIEKHTPGNTDYLELYNISDEELQKGVICSNCSSLPMEINRGRWICKKCYFISKDAHLSALEDYSLLISKEITNTQLRTFLKIPSIYMANKILTSLKVNVTGKNKGRVYHLEID
ncbi:nuclease-related domain-containing protein [Metabacillus litoralis]|uniref:nuclease-related domain-containing protein n=1 Tax=Metabacillus litoralis TaxID=152268 RepID=UPI001CFEB722|nr:nuclease-related domain-containing protein [Metabacillus litoralis]